jgi:hypothetical protein
MVLKDLFVGGMTRDELQKRLLEMLRKMPRDAVVRIRASGLPSEDCRQLLTARNLRDIAPTTMNVELRFTDERNRTSSRL